MLEITSYLKFCKKILTAKHLFQLSPHLDWEDHRGLFFNDYCSVIWIEVFNIILEFRKNFWRVSLFNFGGNTQKKNLACSSNKFVKCLARW